MLTLLLYIRPNHEDDQIHENNHHLQNFTRFWFVFTEMIIQKENEHRMAIIYNIGGS